MKIATSQSHPKSFAFKAAAAMLTIAALPLCGIATANARPLTPKDSHYLAMPAKPSLPTLFIIGDSTVRNGNGTGQGHLWGWGDMLAPFFQTNCLNVVNDALGGTSSRTFYRDRWPGVKDMMKPGDFLVMQFGHNDSSPINEKRITPHTRARGTIRGVGNQVDLITNILTKRFEVVHSFGFYEKQMINEARARGVTPMVCSLIPHNIWKNGRVRTNKKDYGGWAGDVAHSEHAPFLDINDIIARVYDKMGEQAVQPLFVVGGGPHTSLAGAKTNAICVISALKGLNVDPLAKYFSAKADGVKPAKAGQ